MKNCLLFFCFHLLAIVCVLGQKSSLNYRSPLGIPLQLAANFGEIRPDHFHMGVDFKTNGKEGLTIYAIERGFVSRVKISPDGYGKSIYIDHPDGRTSVYAHCSVLKGKIDSLVKTIQTSEQNFEVDIYFRPEDLPVNRGQVIALSGNTGHSFAPHLHFEIRDTKTEDALNPLLFGFDVQDHKAPEIHGMRMYALSKEGYPIPGRSKIVEVETDGQNYTVSTGSLEIPSSYFEYGGIGFAFETSDRLDGGINKCGIYTADLKQDGKVIFTQKMDRVPFNQTRYVNDHVDYALYDQSNEEWQKAFCSESNPLSIYQGKNKGQVYLNPGQSQKMEFTAQDIKGNKRILKFTIKRASGSKSPLKDYFFSEKCFLPDSAYSFSNATSLIELKPLTLYQPVTKKVQLGNNPGIAAPGVPVQLPLEIGIKIPESKTNEKGWYITRTKANGRESYVESWISEGWVYGETKGAGSFQLRQDNSAPKLTPIGFKTSQSITQKQLKWRVNETSTELLDYDLFVDSQWNLIEFERKGNFLIFHVPKSLRGKKEIQLIVTDQCGNVATWKGTLAF
ncbi:MAG: hypothetical protein RIT43_2005 [Bacteroidota bacterium]|jgi:murein DD-endopeptidase MepM/ murein hydrolase activator NlpD